MSTKYSVVGETRAMQKGKDFSKVQKREEARGLQTNVKRFDVILILCEFYSFLVTWLCMYKVNCTYGVPVRMFPVSMYTEQSTGILHPR